MQARVPSAVLAATALVLLCGHARADWTVRRHPLRVAADIDRSLMGAGDDPAAAAHLLRQLGARQRIDVVERLRRHATEQPGDPRIHAALAHALLAAGDATAAAEQFSAALAAQPASLGALWGRGRARARLGHAALAVSDLRAALSLAAGGPRHAVVAAELIDAATHAGELDAEIEGRRAWSRLHPGAAAASGELAAALARGRRFAEAAEVLAAARPQPGRTQAARWALEEGRYWAAADQLARAASLIERARRLAPKHEVALRREVFGSLFDVARRRGALEALAQELGLPRDAVEWETLASIASENGDARGVWNSLNEAIRLRPDDLKLHRRRVEAARRIAGAAELVPLLEQFAAVALRAGADDVYGEALDGLWRMGGQERVARTFERALTAPAGHDAIVRVAAELATKWGDDRRAEQGWREVLRRTPRDQSAIIAVGEARLQRGDRRGAVESWRRLLSGAGPSARAGAHAVLAETLADHEFAEQAIVEAEKAIALAPRQVRYRRVLAGILERQGARVKAEQAWIDVLREARNSEGTAMRREARSHLVALWVRGGAGTVAAKLGELRQQLQEQPGDDELRRCLCELQLRTDRIDEAGTCLSELLAVPSPSDDGSGTVELAFSLVRALRHRQRTNEAMTWLERIAQRFPARARAAQLQLAELAAAAHDDGRVAALAIAAGEAEAEDPAAAFRAAVVEERIGHLESAERMYRRTLARTEDAAAALALAGLMARSGERSTEQRLLLRRAVSSGDDEELVSEAGRRAIVLEEALGSLPELVSTLAESADEPGASARRRVLASALTRLIPDVYRSRDRDGAAAAELRRLGRIAPRALLEVVSGGDDQVAVAAIDALGMLGRQEVAAELSRVLVADDVADVASTERGAIASRSASRLRTTNSEVARALIVALGRLGGEVARGALAAVAGAPHPGLEVPLLWSLGRVKSPLASEMARREVAHPSVNLAIVACLTLGRGETADSVTTLTEVAGDAARDPRVRAAAVVGMALGRRRETIGVLRKVAGAGAGPPSVAAGVAVQFLEAKDAPVRPALDEGTLIRGSSLDPAALVDAMSAALAGGDEAQPP